MLMIHKLQAGRWFAAARSSRLGGLLVMGAGLIVAADRPKPVTLSFRTGVDGYVGTVDAEVWALAPTTILNANPQVTSDSNNDGGESQVLMRFDEIIGEESRRIPPGATIVSARLYVSAFDQGDTVHLHRMLVPFGKAPTWNSLVSGVSADGYEAARTKDAFTFGKIAANSSEISFDVTDTVQGWVNGVANHGWVFLNTGGNGWDFYASDFDKLNQRPRLVVEFQPPYGS
jgi:hypothetical protein